MSQISPTDGTSSVLLKALILDATSPDQASRPGRDVGAVFASLGALEPPYDPEALCLLFEHSKSLRQNVDAYATSIDGFGRRLDPAIDFDADDADRRVGECIYLERLSARDRGEFPPDAELEPTPDEITERRRELVQLGRTERARLASFFEFCSFDHSFVELRRRTRQDLEVTGNAYWEVLRNASGEVARLVYVPSYAMRLLPLDANPVPVEESVRISPVTIERVTTRQRMRRFLQVQYTQRTFFKAFGDPRFVSRTTGEVFASLRQGAREDLACASRADLGPVALGHEAARRPQRPDRGSGRSGGESHGPWPPTGPRSTRALLLFPRTFPVCPEPAIAASPPRAARPIERGVVGVALARGSPAGCHAGDGCSGHARLAKAKRAAPGRVEHLVVEQPA